METDPKINVSRKQFDSEEHRSESPSLRDLFSKKDDDSGLNSERRGANFDRIQSSRTLHDIFKDDPNTTTAKEKTKITKNFSEKLFRRTGSGSGSNWTSSVTIPTSDIPIHPQNSFRNITRWDSTKKGGPIRDGSDLPDSESGPLRTKSAMLQRNASRAIDRPRVRFEGLSDEVDEDEEMTNEGPREETTEEAEENDRQDEDGGGGGGGGGGGEGEEEPVRMSLMSLLFETDKQMGLDGYGMEEDDDDEEEEEAAGDYSNCCVCMVRHKGAAFIPCGHTFCRLCSRELWVQRGNCPLCNNFILEILDIF